MGTLCRRFQTVSVDQNNIPIKLIKNKSKYITLYYRMNPVLVKASESNDLYEFTLAGVNVSLANAIRRTILNDIPTVVLGTEIYQDDKCKIEINTGRLHNELVKQRLSCIPVHISDDKEMASFPNEYVLVVDVTNDTETMMIVTTEDFKIKQKDGSKVMSKEEVRSIFPPDPLTRDFIDFVRLRPKIGNSITGEQIKLVCEFTIGTAKINGTYNVVSKCTYGYTPDPEKAEDAWTAIQQRLAEEDTPKDEIEFQKRNFYLLDAQRYWVPDSFDFQIQTLGVFDNRLLIKKACNILRTKLLDMHKGLESDIVPIKTSLTTVENSFDVVLLDEDYTLGKVLEYILYEKYYKEQEILTYCGFKKFHPHDTESTIRIAYKEPIEKQLLKQHLRDACVMAAEVFEKIFGMF
jgi:DNA-directed RNA polymerase subunit L